MVQLLPCVFSSGRPQNVAMVHAHVGQEFAKVRWLVGLDEKACYMKAGASSVEEVGDLCSVMAFGIGLANTTKTPVVLISDDIKGFFAFVGPLAKWTCHGRKLGLSDFTGRILAIMRQVAAPLGGVSCTANPRVQLVAPEVYSHFFTNNKAYGTWERGVG